MIVHGFEVTPEIERACLAAMVGKFRAMDIEMAASNAGAPCDVVMRIADRLIQRERKAGRIKRVGNRWERVEVTHERD